MYKNTNLYKKINKLKFTSMEWFCSKYIIKLFYICILYFNYIFDDVCAKGTSQF